MEIGTKLRNGAIVLAHKQDYVLALDIDKSEFATWLIDTQGNTCAGYYFHDLNTALDNFKSRLGVIEW